MTCLPGPAAVKGSTSSKDFWNIWHAVPTDGQSEPFGRVSMLRCQSASSPWYLPLYERYQEQDAVPQEWLTMVTKSFFGEKGGVFQQCPEDPATVHPVREHEGCGWEGPEYIRKAGVLAGLLQLHCIVMAPEQITRAQLSIFCIRHWY